MSDVMMWKKASLLRINDLHSFSFLDTSYNNEMVKQFLALLISIC